VRRAVGSLLSRIPLVFQNTFMKRQMKIARSSLVVPSFLEQSISSAGNFLVFYMLARFLGPSHFGIFSAIWVGIMFFLALGSAWVSTALSSVRVPRDREAAFAGVCLGRLLRVLGLTAVLLPVVLVVSVSEINSRPSSLLVSVALGITTLINEFVRRYMARRGLPGLSAVMGTVRYGTSGTLVILTYLFGILSFHAALACLCFGDCAGILTVAWFIKTRDLNQRVAKDAKLAVSINALARPVLVHNLITAVAGVVTAGLARHWIDNAAYGAYAAIMSLCGVFAVFVQLVDIHYSSNLIRRMGGPPPSTRQHNVLLAAALIAATILFFCRHWIVGELLLPQYAAYALLLPILGCNAMVIVLKQIGIAELRVQGYNQIYYVHGLIRVAGMILLPLVILFPKAIESVAVLNLLVAMAQLLAVRGMLIKTRSDKKATIPRSSLQADAPICREAA